MLLLLQDTLMAKLPLIIYLRDSAYISSILDVLYHEKMNMFRLLSIINYYIQIKTYYMIL